MDNQKQNSEVPDASIQRATEKLSRIEGKRQLSAIDVVTESVRNSLREFIIHEMYLKVGKVVDKMKLKICETELGAINEITQAEADIYSMVPLIKDELDRAAEKFGRLIVDHNDPYYLKDIVVEAFKFNEK